MSRKVKKPSRQKIWQDKRRKSGLCIQCGDEPLITKNLGRKCAKKQRERMRKKTGAKTRYKGAVSYLRKP